MLNVTFVSYVGLLEEREGVGVRGARSAAALGLRLYRLSDVEEDDDMPRMPQASHVYTLTNRSVIYTFRKIVKNIITSTV